jgi:hypothetical protein
MTVNDALDAIRQKAAVLRYLSDATPYSGGRMERNALAGVAAMCEDIEALAGRLVDTFGADVLDGTLAAPAARKTSNVKQGERHTSIT